LKRIGVPNGLVSKCWQVFCSQVKRCRYGFED
jgi:hypothetical protein